MSHSGSFNTCDTRIMHPKTETAKMPRKMDWVNTAVADAGWNRPFMSGDETMPKRYKLLFTKLLDKNLVCTSGGNVYVFLSMLNKWSVLCSEEAMISVNALMDIDNASVNYDKAFRPYVGFLERNSVGNISGPLPTSICIGTNRLSVTAINDELLLDECDSILAPCPSYGKHATIRSLCYMPLSVPWWPKEWKRQEDHALLQFISALFPDREEMSTLEWVVGNSLVDPVKSSKAAILYGPGGTGKSTLLACLKIALMGCCGTIPDKALTGSATSISHAMSSVVISNRIVTAGDVGAIGDVTNLSVIKSITGHDYVSIPPLTARTSCSLIYTTNKLDDPRSNKEWSTIAIARRTVVIPMFADATEYGDSFVPQDMVSRIDFALRCVHTRLSNPHMPVSPLSTILTLAGDMYKEVSGLLKACDRLPTVEEGNIVLSVISGAIGTHPDMVWQLAKKISLCCIVEIGRHTFVSRIVPSDQYYAMEKSVF